MRSLPRSCPQHYAVGTADHHFSGGERWPHHAARPQANHLLPIHLRNGVGSRRTRALLSRHSEGPSWSCESAVWVAGISSLAPPLARPRHPDLRREGAVVIGEADSIASCDSLCLDPYGFVSDYLECLSSSLAPRCGSMLSAVPLGFHMTGSIITPRRLAPLQLSYRLSVRAMHQLRVVDVSWHPDCGIGVHTVLLWATRAFSARSRSIRCRSSSADLPSSASIRS